MATDAAQIKSEIARLTASISQHKSKSASTPRYPPTATTSWPPRSSTYVNPNYKPPTNKYIRPTPASRPPVSRPPSTTNVGSTSQVKEVVLNGVAFESSNRSLVRKDLPKPVAPKSKPASASATAPPRSHLPARSHATHFQPQRTYKPKSTRGRGRVRGPVNMTLTNSRRPYTSSRPKRPKSDKPCPRFSTTGASPSLLCAPVPAASPVPTRTTPPRPPSVGPSSPAPAPSPLRSAPSRTTRRPSGRPCAHTSSLVAPAARAPPAPSRTSTSVPATGSAAPSLCSGSASSASSASRRTCGNAPTLREKGTCERKGCRLPHVIRAAGARKLPASAEKTSSTKMKMDEDSKKEDADKEKAKEKLDAEDAKMGDEFISLTFNESSEEDEDEDSDDEESGSSDDSEAEDDGDDAGSDVDADEKMEADGDDVDGGGSGGGSED
ncbi:Zinc finger CCCH domain-containing protein 3 [Mycena venus]|uniref:Zinc finger CCCH domain-containing protein 3 n=1 Tax=Mycena venus TaxID=2733690 RepID=A0A8H7D2H2_9AGAR|nr:Zinc finger CCCH domain-containing protein 3 [Mycena venus]